MVRYAICGDAAQANRKSVIDSWGHCEFSTALWLVVKVDLFVKFFGDWVVKEKLNTSEKYPPHLYIVKSIMLHGMYVGWL